MTKYVKIQAISPAFHYHLQPTYGGRDPAEAVPPRSHPAKPKAQGHTTGASCPRPFGFAEELCNSEILEFGIDKALAGDTGQKLIKEAMKNKRATTAK